MDISRLHPGIAPHRPATATAPGTSTRSEAPEALPPPVEDALSLAQFVATGLVYKLEGSRTERRLDQERPLESQPRVQLERPFVMVPGWTTNPAAFSDLGSKLTEGGINGGQVFFVRDGEFFRDPEAKVQASPESVPADSRVFQVLPKDNHASPEVVADELERSFEAIRQVTGAPRLDVEAYSMGGLSTRVYLDRGGKAVGRLMMLGTPNRGTRFAELAKHIIQRDIRWAMSMGGLTVGDLPALEWMSPVQGKGASNPRLSDLNSRWDEQASRLEDFHAVAGQGLITPADKGGRLFTKGDGLVPVDHTAPPGVEVTVLSGDKHHRLLNREAETYKELIGFFGWTPLSEPAAPPTAT
jgi:pimeloyl-ACP methyl ester carboxylesterase